MFDLTNLKIAKDMAWGYISAFSWIPILLYTTLSLIHPVFGILAGGIVCTLQVISSRMVVKTISIANRAKAVIAYTEARWELQSQVFSYLVWVYLYLIVAIAMTSWISVIVLPVIIIGLPAYWLVVWKAMDETMPVLLPKPYT